jgi:hypothetical protein
MIDLLTIRQRKGHLDHLKIGFCGDLKFGRTVHSLVNSLVRYPGNEFYFISPEKLMPEVRDHEPRMALDGTEDGLYFYRRIIEEAGKHLVSSGMLFFEIGYDQGQAVSELMREHGYREVQVVQDYAGLDRVVFGTYVTVQPAPFAKSR